MSTVTAGIDGLALPAARLWAAGRLPYFSAALFALTPVATPGLGTMAVDRAWRLYVDPDVVGTWTTEQIGTVLIHEANHVLRDHDGRGRAVGVTKETAVAWNAACDAEINDDLLALRLPLPGTPVTPRTLGAKAGRLAEEYFRKVRPHAGPGPDCGSGAHGHSRDWEREAEAAPGDVPQGVSAAEADLLRRQVAAAIGQASRAGRHVPVSMTRWATELLEPTVDWRRELGSVLRRSVGWAAGSVDYTWARRSRRGGSAHPVLLPGLGRPVPEVAVVADTSASMEPDDLTAMLAEIDGILAGVGLRRRAAVLSVDTRVRRTQRVARAGQVRLRGGGGTDLGVGIDAATRLRPAPSVIVVLTDGYTPWPHRAPRNATVVVGLIGADPPEPPAWARAVHIGDQR